MWYRAAKTQDDSADISKYQTRYEYQRKGDPRQTPSADVRKAVQLAYDFLENVRENLTKLESTLTTYPLLGTKRPWRRDDYRDLLSTELHQYHIHFDHYQWGKVADHLRDEFLYQTPADFHQKFDQVNKAFENDLNSLRSSTYGLYFSLLKIENPAPVDVAIRNVTQAIAMARYHSISLTSMLSHISDQSTVHNRAQDYATESDWTELANVHPEVLLQNYLRETIPYEEDTARKEFDLTSV